MTLCGAEQKRPLEINHNKFRSDVRPQSVNVYIHKKTRRFPIGLLFLLLEPTWRYRNPLDVYYMYLACHVTESNNCKSIVCVVDEAPSCVTRNAFAHGTIHQILDNPKRTVSAIGSIRIMDRLPAQHRHLLASAPFIVSSSLKFIVLFAALVCFWFYYRAQFRVEEPQDDCTVVSLDSDHEENEKDIN